MRNTWSYEDAAAYIEEIPKFTKKHPLVHTREFIRRLGDPAVDKKVIHVAGTNGKGSVCAYLQAILMEEKKRTGFFTSPHLVSVNERIRINNVQIDNETFLRIFLQTLCVAEQMEKEGLGHPSYFEFLYGMGMLAFEEADVEYIVLETGLGGRLDCTNSVEHPVLTVITSISLDHTAILGDTIEEVAAEKAGIIKPGVPVFYDGSNPEAAAVIRNRAKELGAPCREISKNAFEIREVTRKYIAFSRVNAYDKSVIFRVPFCGSYQVMNAEIALEAAEYLLKNEASGTACLDRREEPSEEEALDTACLDRWEDPSEEGTSGTCRRWADAIESIHWEGRMEQVTPHIMIDGAHNPGAIEAFVESVRLLEDKVPPVIVFSAVADKKYEQMIAYLCEHLTVQSYIVTEIEDERKVPVETLEGVFRRYTDRPVIRCKRLEDALHAAEEQRADGGIIYCLGSLYLAGMIKKLLGDSKNAEF
jgi:dihydrofolate synthase/folylpolyglutamate synthase